MFQGTFTALITPFHPDESVDYPSLERLLRLQMKRGIQGFVVCGTTGEGPTLTPEESLSILDFICQRVDSKTQILFNSGSNSTKKTITFSHRACQYPIHGLLAVVPYYNKPSPQGIQAHFEKIAQEVEKPLVLYNVPSRTLTELPPEIIIELSKHPNIQGIKEAHSNLNAFLKYKDHVPEDFSCLSGNDENSIEFCLLGGHGVISVASHLAPRSMVSWVNRARRKDPSVEEEFSHNKNWIQSLYRVTNPVAVKAALAARGVISCSQLRLPLVEMSEDLRREILLALTENKESP